MVTVWLLVSLLCLWAVTIHCASDSNLFEGVSKVLNVIDKPFRISTVFCGNVAGEFELIRGLSMSRNFSTIPISRLREDPEHIYHLIIVDVALCPQPELLAIFQNNPMNLAYSHWLIVNSLNLFGTITGHEIVHIFRDVNITQMSEVFYLTMAEKKLKLRQVYKMERLHPGQLVYEDFGYFPHPALSQFNDTRAQIVTGIRRMDMQGLPLPIALVITNPETMNHFYDLVDAEVDTLSKSGYRLAVTVFQFMNATPQIIPSKSWGSYNATTGVWSGMMGDLISGAGEFGGTPAIVRDERVDIVEFLSISLESWTKIVFRAPKLSYTTNVYLLPFETSVWLVAFFLFGAVALLLLAAEFLEWKSAEEGSELEEPKMIDNLFVVFSAICDQGTSFCQNSVGGRIVFLSFLVTIVCLFVSYCAFIVVLLQTPANNIRTGRDLLNSRMEVGSENTIYNYYWLMKLTDPVDQEILEKRMTNKDGSLNFIPLEEGIRKMQKGFYAFHMETPVAYRVVNKIFDEAEKCDLREIDFADIAYPYATCRRNTPYREAFRVGMLRMKESGVQRRIWAEVHRSKPKCNTRSGYSVLSLIDISPVIVIFSIGVVVSLLILLGEIVWARYELQKGVKK